MSDLLGAIQNTPLPTILVLAGIVFWLLAIAGSIAGKITVQPNQQKIAGVVGSALLVSGLFLYFFMRLPPSPPTPTTPGVDPCVAVEPGTSCDLMIWAGEMQVPPSGRAWHGQIIFLQARQCVAPATRCFEGRMTFQEVTQKGAIEFARSEEQKKNLPNFYGRRSYGQTMIGPKGDEPINVDFEGAKFVLKRPTLGQSFFGTCEGEVTHPALKGSDNMRQHLTCDVTK